MLQRAVLSAILMVSAAIAQTSGAPAPPTDPIVVEGKVTNASTGEPLRKASVTLRPMSQQSPYAATTDAEGAFRFENVEPGSYRLGSERQGYVNAQYGTRRPYAAGTLLKVSAGQKLTGLKLQMTPNASISGRVLDEDGDPLGRTMIRLFRYGFIQSKWQLIAAAGANSDDNGEFKASNLAPGKYYLAATPMRAMSMDGAVRSATGKPTEEIAYVETYYPGSLDVSGASAIEVSAGRDVPSTDIRMRKVKVYHIRGQVLVEGRPSRDFRIMVNPRSASGGVMMTFGPGVMAQADGKFDLANLRPGSYDLMALNSGGQLRIGATAPVEVGDTDVENVTLNVVPSQSIRGTVVIEQDAAAAASTDKGQPLRLFLMPSAFAFNSPSALVKEDSSFTLENVAPGKYRLAASGGPPNSYVKSVRWNDQEVADSIVDLTTGVSGTPVVTISSKGGQIDGKLISDKPPAEKPAPGKPVPAADASAQSLVYVVLLPDPPQPETTNLTKLTVTDQTGQFSLKGIRPGRYKLYAWEDIEQGAWTDPEVIKYYDGKGVSVTISEGGHESLSVPLISAEAVAEQRTKLGR